MLDRFDITILVSSGIYSLTTGIIAIVPWCFTSNGIPGPGPLTTGGSYLEPCKGKEQLEKQPEVGKRQVGKGLSTSASPSLCSSIPNHKFPKQLFLIKSGQEDLNIHQWM